METPVNVPRLNLAKRIATGFGAGDSPWAPGTVGSAVAMVLFWLSSFIVELNTLGTFYIAVAMTMLAVWAANVVYEARVYGEEKDPSPVVIDEFAGYAVSVIGSGSSIWSLFLCFVCFRVFDIFKPAPAKQLEKLPGGYGIVFDDVMAGIYAGIAAQVITRVLM